MLINANTLLKSVPGSQQLNTKQEDVLNRLCRPVETEPFSHLSTHGQPI